MAVADVKSVHGGNRRGCIKSGVSGHGKGNRQAGIYGGQPPWLLNVNLDFGAPRYPVERYVLLLCLKFSVQPTFFPGRWYMMYCSAVMRLTPQAARRDSTH